MGSVAEVVAERDMSNGFDPITNTLGVLAADFEDIQKVRKAVWQRSFQHFGKELADNDASVVSLLQAEGRVSRALSKTLQKHPLWPWLEDKKGVAGPLTARLIAIINDPHRFPGQKCSEGHYHRPVHGAGAPCPVEVMTAVETSSGCTGVMLPPRPHSGTRSLWHYLGVHVIDGRSPRKQKGVQSDWNTKGRTLLLGPHGLADQVVLHRTQPWRDIYDGQKERLGQLRLAERLVESDRHIGEPLRPFQVDALAKKIAVKSFAADLLQEWKRRWPL